jgi:hypothetical protein
MKTNILSLAALCGLFSTTTMTAQTHAILPLFPPSISTVPANGDGNPYGVAVVPRSLLGTTVLQQGDILVSNFNNSDNIQGGGTTIVRIDHLGQQTVFYQGKGLGFTGALGILSNGIVVAGSLPTTDGTAATATAGSLLFIDPRGNLLTTINGPGTINGPWGLTIHDFGGGAAQIFVSNVLNGNIVRFDVTYDAGAQSFNILRTVTVASGYSHRPDPGAVVLGPSGLAYDPAKDILYAASSTDNAVYAIAQAGAVTGTQGMGSVIFNDATKLHGPVNMALAPNGHLLISNSDGGSPDRTQPSELVEITTTGQFIAQYSLDESLGASFGIAVTTIAPGVARIVTVDDNDNTVNTWITVLQ